MRRVVREFRRRAETTDDVAVIDDAGRHRASDLLRHATPLVDDLSGTVLLQADNSWRTVAATLAVGLSGGTLAVVNRHTTTAEFAAALEDIQPDVVVAEPAAVAEWAVPGTRDAAVLDGWVARSVSRYDGSHRDVARWEGGSLIGLTSGSTGRAKGVVQSEAAMHYATSQTVAINGLRPGDAVAAIVPLSSTAAYCFGVYLALMLGGPLVLPGRWDPAAALRRMAAEDVRWTMCVPTMALQLGAAAAGSRALRGMRALTVGGGPMEAAALRRAEESLGTRILRVFGMSECLGHTSPAPDDPPEIRLGRDGRPFPGTQLRAVDADGVPVRPGETGRAQVRGPSLFLGYARDGKPTPPELTADGFLPTGDLLVLDADGTVTIMGREKDIIIRGGRNIDITEVERAIASHPRVAQVCVAPVPDEVLGERAAALIVSADAADLRLDEVTAHLHDLGLSRAKWPEYVFTVADLPQTAVGKLSRAGARDLAHELHAGGAT